MQDTWFQQNDATCYTACVTINLGEFGEHFISRSGSVNWPYRLYDLMALDYCLWTYVKVLEDNIEAFIWEIPTEMLDRICQYWTKRMDNLMRSRGQHLHEIIFKC